MARRGHRKNTIAPAGVITPLLEYIDQLLSWIGAMAVTALEALFQHIFVKVHSLKERGYELIYQEHRITKEIIGITFTFKRAIADQKAYTFLYRLISRTCSTIPVDLAIPARSKGHCSHTTWCQTPLKGKTQFARLTSTASCIDRSCTYRLFEIWENHDPLTCLRFHLPKGLVKEISISGSHPLLRRLFHFA